MKPVAVTFVDDKMMNIAVEQSENMKQFGLDHEIINISDVGAYDTHLWIHLADLMMDAINRHGKIMRLDAEVRLHKPLPQHWLDNDNVFFQPYPFIKSPYFAAMNTGQMIVGRSGLEFCRLLKECMIGLIPPDGDTNLDGTGHHIADDIVTSAIAIRVSGVEYVQEYLKMDRTIDKVCAANRGNWIEESTILTHPTIHNWNYHGAGMLPLMELVPASIIMNHFQGDVGIARLIIKLLRDRNQGNMWDKLARRLDDGWCAAGGWYFQPSTGLCAPEEHWPHCLRRIED